MHNQNKPQWPRVGGSAPHVGFRKYVQNTGKSTIFLIQYRGQMHTGYGPPSSYWIMLFLSMFYTYSQAPTHRISPPTPSIDRNSQKREPLVLFLLLKMIFKYAIWLNENLIIIIFNNTEHFFKCLLVKGKRDLYLVNYQARHMLPSVTGFRECNNYNWVRLERSGTFQFLAARIYNLSTVACVRDRYLETFALSLSFSNSPFYLQHTMSLHSDCKLSSCSTTL